jgi:hypothetical protein
MRTPVLELLWWEGCPSTDAVLADLRAALTEMGLDGAAVTLREIRTDDEADEAEFLGSPTILIDGSDPFASVGEQPVGLTCRLYRRRNGRISPTPDPDDLRHALRAAAEREEVRN